MTVDIFSFLYNEAALICSQFACFTHIPTHTSAKGSESAWNETAMPKPSPTLFAYLTQANPIPDSTNSIKGPNTESPFSIDPDHIEKWDEFCIQALRDSYGDVLAHTIPAGALL